jgi:hypothetical protein
VGQAGFFSFQLITGRALVKKRKRKMMMMMMMMMRSTQRGSRVTERI